MGRYVYFNKNTAYGLFTGGNSVLPFFTALAGFAASRGKERPHRRFIFGFVLAMAGIYLISTAESGMQFNLTR
ncbi:hypothetical protein M3079_03120 [Phascolarctobacterium sp. ET69]|nr:hypothetical protein [Phascolarctobacterium sp. ET69]MCL1604979.1 hypothetical protein [Phascolarctobacterium sp. ET69]